MKHMNTVALWIIAAVLLWFAFSTVYFLALVARKREQNRQQLLRDEPWRRFNLPE